MMALITMVALEGLILVNRMFEKEGSLMAITSFGDIAGIVEHWRADDVTLTGNVVETMVGQEGNYDLDNPNASNSDSLLEASVTPKGFPGVDMSTSLAAELEGTTPGNTNANYSWVLVYRQDRLDAGIHSLLTLDQGTAGSRIEQEEGLLTWLWKFNTYQTASTLGIGDIVTVVGRHTSGETTLHWEGAASGSDSNAATGGFSTGNLHFNTGTGGLGRAQNTLIAAAYYSVLISESDRDDIFAYAAKEFIDISSDLPVGLGCNF